MSLALGGLARSLPIYVGQHRSNIAFESVPPTAVTTNAFADRRAIPRFPYSTYAEAQPRSVPAAMIRVFESELSG